MHTERLSGEGYGTVIAPKNEVEDDEGHHDAKNARQGKIKPLLHYKEREKAFEDLVETRSVPSRGQPKTPLHEARQAIPQHAREREQQPCSRIKTFDPCTCDRERDRKQVAAPGLGGPQQGAAI
jgi:hypothetical protein